MNRDEYRVLLTEHQLSELHRLAAWIRGFQALGKEVVGAHTFVWEVMADTKLVKVAKK